MRYLLLIASSQERDARMSPEEAATRHAGWGQFTTDLMAADKMRGGERLRPVGDATTVRVEDGRTLLTDGPFAETKEQLGGYYMIEAKDLDDAISWAKQMPHLAFGGSVEIRPVWEMS